MIGTALCKFPFLLKSDIFVSSSGKSNWSTKIMLPGVFQLILIPKVPLMTNLTDFLLKEVRNFGNCDFWSRRKHQISMCLIDYHTFHLYDLHNSLQDDNICFYV